MADALDQGAAATGAEVFGEHLALRADAVRTGSFERAAEFGASRIMPFELILGPSPSWTHPAIQGSLTATLALPVSDGTGADLARTDTAVAELAEACLARLGLLTDSRSYEPPIYSVCDLRWIAGEAAIAPQHFASFLPEDEGLLGITTKTLVYRNLYVARFLRVAVPLVRRFLGSPITVRPEDAAQVLLQWLRAHDLAHSYFDNLCRRSGLGQDVLHATRELIADSLADAVVLADPRSDKAATILLAEKLRYGRRDPDRFADAMAARIEITWLAQTLRIEDLTDASKVAAAAFDLVEETLSRLTNSDAGGFEKWAQRLAREHQVEGVTQAEPHDVIPIFVAPLADQARGPGQRTRPGCLHP